MILIPNLTKGVQAPTISLPNQSKNGTEVVGEDNTTKPTNVTQTCSLEDFFFLTKDLFAPLGIVCWDRVGVFIGATFVYFENLPSDVLMEMEHEKEEDTDQKKDVRCGYD